MGIETGSTFQIWVEIFLFLLFQKRYELRPGTANGLASPTVRADRGWDGTHGGCSKTTKHFRISYSLRRSWTSDAW